MNETQYLALAHLPGGIRTAAGQRLDADEQVRHALLLEQYPDDDEAWSDVPVPALALVVTDRQLLVLAGGPPHLLATVDAVTPRLVCPLDSLVAVEVGTLLLRAWLEFRFAARGALECVRVPISYVQVAAVRLAVCDLLGPAPVRMAGEAPTTGPLAELPALLRQMVQSLCPPEEQAVAVLHALPKERPARGWRRLRAAPEERPLRSVVATGRRLILLEQSPAMAPGALRFGLITTLCPLAALQDVGLAENAGPVAMAHLRLGREGAAFSYEVDLERAEEHRWGTALAALAVMRHRPAASLQDAERRRFVLATGLGQVVLTDPAHYATLLRHVEEHRTVLASRGHAGTLAEAARDWCHAVYEPIAARLKAGHARLRLPDRTLADLYVRLCEHKWLVSERARRDIGLEAALQDFERWAS